MASKLDGQKQSGTPTKAVKCERPTFLLSLVEALR